MFRVLKLQIVEPLAKLLLLTPSFKTYTQLEEKMATFFNKEIF